LLSYENLVVFIKYENYIFFIDLEGHRLDDDINGILNDMEENTSFFKILGSYPVFREDLFK
jgi:prephenate dehydratase